MPEYTFIHAADLHLGAPFRGLDAAVSERFSGNILTEAPFTALERLEALCRAEKAAFLLIAGDMYDSRDGVLRARFALRDMFARLGEAGVQVFLAHGNHDPLAQGGEANPVPWPDNVTVFDETPRTVCVMRDGKPLALVQGVSHTTPREAENLALRFGDPKEGLSPELSAAVRGDILKIAVLHCAVGGAGDGHAPYAPCVLGDLTKAGFDYWALGHVHQPKQLCEAPAVVYAGSMQGLHINETGPHGCQVVRVNAKGCTPALAPLAPVVWEKVAIDVDTENTNPETLDDIIELMLERLERAAQPAAGAGGAYIPDAVFCRAILKGHTHLDRELRKPGARETLLERVREEMAAQDAAQDPPARTRVWLKDITLQTTPLVDFSEIAKRDDLMGEVVRIADAACADDATLRAVTADALDDLYAHRKMKKAVTRPDAEEMRLLTASARSLLCSLLEED